MTGIRTATLPDAGPWAAVVLAASPHLVIDEASAAHEMRTDSADAQRFVAVQGEAVVAVARSRTYAEEDHVSLMVMVHPDHRRRGVGGALLDRLLETVADAGKPRAIAIVDDDPGSRIASERWGFSDARQLQTSMVDPRTVPDPGPPPAGLAVVPLADVASEEVWRAHQQVPATTRRVSPCPCPSRSGPPTWPTRERGATWAGRCWSTTSSRRTLCSARRATAPGPT